MGGGGGGGVVGILTVIFEHYSPPIKKKNISMNPYSSFMLIVWTFVWCN